MKRSVAIVTSLVALSIILIQLQSASRHSPTIKSNLITEQSLQLVYRDRPKGEASKKNNTPPKDKTDYLHQEEEELFNLSERVKEELEASKLDNAASIAEELLKQAACCRGT